MEKGEIVVLTAEEVKERIRRGETEFKGVTIMDSLDLRKVRAPCLNFARSTIKGTLYLSGADLPLYLDLSGLKIQGSIDLDEARIGGQVSLKGASIGGSLNLEGVKIGFNLDLEEATISDHINLIEAKIDGGIVPLTKQGPRSIIVDPETAEFAHYAFPTTPLTINRRARL